MGLPSCREVAVRLSREQDDRSASPDRRSVALRAHLLLCRHCRRYAHQLAWLRATLGQIPPPVLSDATRSRIRTQMNNASRPVGHGAKRLDFKRTH